MKYRIVQLQKDIFIIQKKWLWIWWSCWGDEYAMFHSLDLAKAYLDNRIDKEKFLPKVVDERC